MISFDRIIELLCFVMEIPNDVEADTLLEIVNKEAATVEERNGIFWKVYDQCGLPGVNPGTKQWKGLGIYTNEVWQRHTALLLAKKLEVDVSSYEVLRAFGASVSHGDQEFVEICLERGISPNVPLDEEGNTAMHYAVLVSREFAEMMQVHGGSYAVRNKKDETPLVRLIRAIHCPREVLGEYSHFYRYSGRDHRNWVDTACWITDYIVEDKQ